MSQKFVQLYQHDSKDCGPTCLQMVHRFYGGNIPITRMRELCDLTLDGVSIQGLANGAEVLGLDAFATPILPEALDEIPTPFIAHWLQDHFVVVRKVDGDKITVSDPELGTVKYSRKAFLDHWLGQKLYGEVKTDGLTSQGTVLILSPNDTFKEVENLRKPKKLIQFSELFINMQPDAWKVMIAFPVTMAIAIALPLILQRVIDSGVIAKDISVLGTLLFGYLVLSLSRNIIGALRDLILLRIGSSISIEIVSRFIQRLLSLRISFFERRSLGDLVQRQNDHKRVEQFLTTQSLPMIFSLLTIIIFAVMLGNYSPPILLVFLIFAGLTIVWTVYFRKIRRSHDMQKFELEGIVQENMIEIMSAVVDLKSFGMVAQKGRFYRSLLQRRYDATSRALRLDEVQNIGAVLLMDVGEIAALFLAGRMVINTDGSLGSMIAIMYILGQMRGPLDRLVPFFQAAQDAWLSLDRLQSLQEEPAEMTRINDDFDRLPPSDLCFKKVSFKYNEMHAEFILHDLDFTLKAGSKTALVGTSGSGKTTLLKLISKFHEPSAGRIEFGGIDLVGVSPDAWRARLGPVLQDGTIFNSSLKYNIVLSHGEPDEARLETVLEMANVSEFSDRLPFGLKTTIGRGGWQLSAGQKQRVLIARALYRDPEILIFDEATSALDSNNEAEITKNISDMLKGRTSVVVSHRLSTIRDADLILMLEGGRIVERGTHSDLVAIKGKYNALFQHQK